MNPNIAAEKAGRAIGSMLFAFFGALWLVWWCLEFVGVAPAVLAAIGVGAVAIFLLALRQLREHKWALAEVANSPETLRGRKIFNWVNGGQWVAVFIAATILVNTGHPEWIRAAIIFIVGAHFLPLAATFRYRWHYVTGGALIALALVYPFLTPAGPLNPVGLFGAGAILWFSALVGVLTGRPAQSAPSTNPAR